MSAFKRRKHPYYSLDLVLSYNAVYNFIVGARGLGKTYGFKKRAIQRHIDKGHQFIYLRRYKTELGPARNTFLSDISDQFPDQDFKIQGMTIQRSHITARDDKKREWLVMGYFVSLSTAQTMKSVSFHDVRTIIFDEFIIEKGAFHYLPDEAKTFNNFYNTVDRNQDKTTVYFLANSVSIMNPYFMEYEIRPDQVPVLHTKMNGFILVHFPDSDEFKQSVSNTRFGRFIAGTDYEEYAVGNQFADNHNNLIEGKPSSARWQYNLETKVGKFSVWYNTSNSTYYVQEKLANTDLKLFTLVPELMDKDKTLMGYRDKLMAYLRASYNNGNVIFDKPKTRNAFIDIFKR